MTSRRRSLPRFQNVKAVGEPPSSLKTVVLERLRQDITTGVLSAGALLFERRLADRFGVSKTPVREALIELQHEGLVEVVPRGGYLVAKISMDDARDSLWLRGLLEGEAAGLAASRRTPQDIDTLNELLHRFASIEAGETSHATAVRYREVNHDFHVAIARASKNTLLTELVERLVVAVERLLTYDIFAASSLRLLGAGHKDIFDAIRKGESERAKELMKAHISHTADRILAVGNLHLSFSNRVNTQ